MSKCKELNFQGISRTLTKPSHNIPQKLSYNNANKIISFKIQIANGINTHIPTSTST